MARNNFKRNGGKFIKLDYWIIDHPAYQRLPAASKVVLQAVWRRYNGTNNGNLVAPISHLILSCNLSKNTVRRALETLEKNGFLYVVERGRLGVSGMGRPSIYRLTFLQDKDGKAPTMDFRKN